MKSAMTGDLGDHHCGVDDIRRRDQRSPGNYGDSALNKPSLRRIMLPGLGAALAGGRAFHYGDSALNQSPLRDYGDSALKSVAAAHRQACADWGRACGGGVFASWRVRASAETPCPQQAPDALGRAQAVQRRRIRGRVVEIPERGEAPEHRAGRRQPVVRP
jgi:hypothetical protein